MKLSPSLMSEFPSDVIETNHGRLPFYHWTGTWSAWLDLVNRINAEQSEGAAKFRTTAKSFCEKTPGSWYCIGQSFREILETGFYARALESFKTAEARLEADRYSPGS